MNANPLQELSKFGQSVWYDNISREIIRNGELDRLIDEMAVVGITSNPTIFDKAISGSDIYDSVIEEQHQQGLAPDKIFETIAIQDVGSAADILRPVYDSTEGNDGYVSIEVSPLLASETEATVQEALRLFEQLARPNIMIKVPGTAEGIPAVRTLLEGGVNVNITLLFSVENYVEVAKTYCDALRVRLEKGLAVDKLRSVASFFVSRVDTAVDAAIEKVAETVQRKHGDLAEFAKSLRGQFAVANSKLAYQEYQRIFSDEAFGELKRKGAAVQRPLWASTGVKNPTYRDVLYIEELIGPNTVNTMPQLTMEAFADHGKAAATVEAEIAEAKKLEDDLLDAGVEIGEILEDLQVEGVKKFADSFHALNKTISQKIG